MKMNKMASVECLFRFIHKYVLILIIVRYTSRAEKDMILKNYVVPEDEQAKEVDSDDAGNRLDEDKIDGEFALSSKIIVCKRLLNLRRRRRKRK